MSPLLSVGSMTMFFLLGLRHGIEPDHIAAIDGLTLRAHDRGHGHAPWTGTLFALGHGLAVAMIAAAVGLLITFYPVPASVGSLLDWLPVVLLTLLGAWNLKVLLMPGLYQPSSLRMKLIPGGLRARSDIWSIMAIGLVFALVVDTLVHISAWSVFATQQGGWFAGVLAGLLFALGMLVASTASSQLISGVLRRNTSPAALSRARRAIGWGVVVLSFGLVIQAIVGKLGDGAG